MPGSRFTRIGGFGALVGGTLWVASFGVAQAISPEYKFLLMGPVLLMLLGLAALQARHATGSGRLGKAGFGVTLIGLVLLAYGSVGDASISGTLSGAPFGPIVIAGLAAGSLVLGAGAALTALSMIIANVMPRLSPIPLLIGATGVAAAGGLALGHQIVGGSGDVFPLPIGPLAALWAVFGLGWLWLGYLLWVERTPAAERARAALRASETR
ncbi:MAG: hypothetical protein E6J17_05340 [Chloroflexi bacterium]|nr:MAG: hypothetical protein E6J17_05340 [Chloroflexota bacterium]